MGIFQVADKGLSCARNIYAATKDADDEYIFSKSIHGRNLSEKEKKWLLLENDQNIWKAYRDKDGNLLYRLKSCIDNISVLHEQNQICVYNGRKPVRDYKARSVLHQGFHGLANLNFCTGINAGSCFVQNDDRRVTKEHSSDG